jgi:hypothetical protein
MAENASKSLKPPDLTIAIDLGGSLTKAFYYDNGNLKLLQMEPEVADVSEFTLKTHLQQLVGSSHPENVAWVRIVDRSQDTEAVNDKTEKTEQKAYRFQAVGQLAKNLDGNARLKQLKYEPGVTKVLAAIAVARQRLKLPQNLTVALAVLLPYGEYLDKTQLEQLLRENTSYIFNGERISINLWLYDCKPEGGGMALIRDKQLGPAFRKKNTAVLMLGHRNASLLFFDKGTLAYGCTSDYGFIDFVKRVDKKTSGYNFERLTSILIQAGYELDPKAIERLARAQAGALRAKEVQRTTAAIREARTEFVEALLRWVHETMAERDLQDETIVCGGAADYFKPDLQDRFEIPLVWHLQNLPNNISDDGLGQRLLDVYGVATHLRLKVDKQVEQKQQAERKK